MWQCKQCGFINNNSSSKCHGLNCKAERRYEAVEMPAILTKKKEKEYRAFCPNCQRPVTVVKAGRLRMRVTWKCNSCHKRFWGIGKAEEVKEESV